MPITHKFYPARLKLFKEIYIGHTPVSRIDEENPVNMANVWNVDTGAAFKGKLSGIDVDSKKYGKVNLFISYTPVKQVEININFRKKS